MACDALKAAYSTGDMDTCSEPFGSSIMRPAEKWKLPATFFRFSMPSMRQPTPCDSSRVTTPFMSSATVWICMRERSYRMPLLSSAAMAMAAHGVRGKSMPMDTGSGRSPWLVSTSKWLVVRGVK